jgi:chromosome segregation ATPase
MKRFTGLALFCLIALAVPLKAQTVDQKVTTILAAQESKQEKIFAIHDLLQAASDKRDALKAEKAPKMPILDKLNADVDDYNRVVADHDARVKDSDANMANQNQAAAVHNAHQCTYTDGHESDCAAYEAEGNRINQWGAEANRLRDNLNAAKYELDQEAISLKSRMAEYNAWRDDFNTRVNENEHNIDLLMRVLGQLQKSNISCQDVLKDPKSTDEAVKEACGHLFDGNGKQDPLTHSGTGGITPNN